MLTRAGARKAGWAVILVICLALTIALTMRVNAVRSQVLLTERQIVALRQEKGMLETEFETRANQQQLKALNDTEFGYSAPTAGQYLESERQLAAYGKPRLPGAPSPIRVASAGSDDRGREVEGESPFPALANPLTGRALAAELPNDTLRGIAAASEPAGGAVVQRLSYVEKPRAARPHDRKAAAD
ncbi:MAG: hypothetical protein V4579_11770 [Pseudomonadota bacterium]